MRSFGGKRDMYTESGDHAYLIAFMRIPTNYDGNGRITQIIIVDHVKWDHFF